MWQTQMNIRPYILVASLCLGALAPMCGMSDVAWAQSVQITTQATEIYAGMPFQLAITVSDFDEDPQPEITPFEIDDAEIQLLGVSPRIMSSTTIINGRMTQKKDVSFIFNYQITPKHEGVYTIPYIHATQGSKEATSQQKLTFTASTVKSTKDMRIELQLPERKIWVGETFDVNLAWYIRKDVQSQVFSIPVLEMPDTFDVAEPDDAPRGRSIPMTVGSRQLAFPFTRDSVMVGGLEYTRFLIPIKVTALKSGVIVLPASKVMAELESGRTQDMWGFGRSTYQLFQVEDQARTLTIQELPQNSKPATFSNAMGTDYSIQVSADRTIVKVGDPIVLTIDITSASNMDGLILPSLASAGLNEQLFSVTNTEPIGENIDGGGQRYIKRFSVPVRIKSERVTEIPPLAFSYFNPKTEEFSTVRSQPIALSVTSVDKISAADVFSTKKEIPAANHDKSGADESETDKVPTTGSLELSLNSTKDDLKSSTQIRSTLPLRIGLYALPFVAWIALALVRRTKKNRDSNAVQREAIKNLKEAIQTASKQSPREAASCISNALNAFLTATETPKAPFQSLCERMDNEAYRPEAIKLPKELLDEFSAAIPKHVNPAYAKLVSSIFALFMAIAVFFVPQISEAQSENEIQQYHQAVEAYQKAMAQTEHASRIAGFKQAYTGFSVLAQEHPSSVALHVDAGHAALGAVDYGHAALAYKRALELDPAQKQAQNNLAYIRSVQNEEVKSDVKIISTAFFLNDRLSRDSRLLIAAILFALGMLLIVPWSVKHRKIMAYVAIFPLFVWIWVLAGVWVEPEKNEAVVMNEVFLKTADNVGASNVSSVPLEPGHTVNIVRSNADWHQVQTMGGQQGWVQNSAIERVKE